MKKCSKCSYEGTEADFNPDRNLCKTCGNERVRIWRENNPAKYKDHGVIGHLRRRYGLTLEAYNLLLLSQGNVCAVCRNTCKTGTRLSVDHDHETGRVRGLLCRQCNVCIGNAQNSPTLLRSLAVYLEKK